MGFFDMLEAALPWSTAEAEAPKEEEEEKVCGSFLCFSGACSGAWRVREEHLWRGIGMEMLGAL
jgi:hypothetical protein